MSSTHQTRSGGPGLGLRLAAMCAAAAAPLMASAAELTFERAFSAAGEPPALHFQATVANATSEHRLEIWRDGDRRLKRRTDDAVEIYAARRSGEVEYQLSVLDLRKRIHTRIDRSNLYRIGGFVDWFDLAHGLRRPSAAYRIARVPAPAGAPRPLEACDWYDLSQGPRRSFVCWSRRSRIPMLVQSETGQVVWRVTALDRRAIPPDAFTVRDEGFVRNDANADIEGD